MSTKGMTGITEDPPWRKRCSGPKKSTLEMLEDICKMRKGWMEWKESNLYDSASENQLRQQMTEKFLLYLNIGEEVGLKTHEQLNEVICYYRSGPRYLHRSLSREGLETINLYKAWNYVTSLFSKEDGGFLELDETLREVHKIAMDKLITNPGVYSKHVKLAEWRGKIHKYPELTQMQMQEALMSLEMRINAQITKHKDHVTVDSLASMVTSVACFVTEFLGLHPFSDGNGRTARLLAAYIMLNFCPFPTPIFNVYSQTSRDDYIDALVSTNQEEIVVDEAKDMAALILECLWHSWSKWSNVLM